MTLRSGVEKAASPFFATTLPFFRFIDFLAAFFAETGNVNTAVLGVIGCGPNIKTGLGRGAVSDRVVSVCVLIEGVAVCYLN